MKNPGVKPQKKVTIFVMVATIFYGCSINLNWPSSAFPDFDQANQYFEAENWNQAILEFEKYLVQYPNNIQARFKLGQSLFAKGSLDKAYSEFKKLTDSDSNIPTEVYFWAGRSSQMLDRFTEAESYYRSYVEKEEHVDLALVAYYLRQIGAAQKAGIAETRYLIENVGNKVNSAYDEFRPIYSPNVDQRFYFSTHYPAMAHNSPISELHTPSMSYAEVKQGIWENQGALDVELAENDEYQLLEFSTDGQRVLYTLPHEDGTRATYQKSFAGSPVQSVSEWQHPVYNSVLGDRDLYVINDSALLFSSNRLEGYGGYDIFVTFLRLGEWLVQNLGPEINSPYDEISPFLSNDGRELYFSTNSDKSIGGYDVFFATFDDEMETWSTPQNLLPPLNSGQNEVGFRLSQDGQHALFSSDRSGGQGGLDVYQVYFDEQRLSQIRQSHPGYFYQVRAFHSFSSRMNNNVILTEKPVYKLPMIFYGERPSVITPQIRKELDRVLEYSKLFPHTELILRIYTEKETQDQFALYRPVLVLKKVLDYMKEGGLDPARMELRLLGNQYPRYTSASATSSQSMGLVRSSNQRLEFDFVNTENLPIQFGVPFVQPEEGVRMSPFQEWKNRTQNLYFRIKLIETEQLIKGADYASYDDFMLSISGNGAHFTYYGGIFSNIADAKQALGKYIAKGFLNAEVIAFIASTKVKDDQISSTMIQSYPELKEYIIYQK